VQISQCKEGLTFQKKKAGKEELTMAKVINWLNEHLEEYVLCNLLAVISIVMMLQVIMRYVFNASLTWAEELCRYAFIWSAFVSIGFTIREKSILTLTFFVDILPKKISKVVTVLAKLVTVAFFVVIFVYSIPMIEKIYSTNQTSPAMGIPMYIVYLSIAVGSFLTIIRSIQDLVVAMKSPCS